MRMRQASRIPPLRIVCLFASLSVSLHAWSSTQYSVRGLVLRVDPSTRTMVVSCESIPGFMDAMIMPFSVLDAKELQSLSPGTAVDFTLVVEKESSHAENVRIHHFDSQAQEPLQAKRLAALQKALQARTPVALLQPGEQVPDFTLTDQMRRQVSLHQFAGEVVVLGFVYTRCPLPDYCFRFSNYFGRLQKRFADRAGKDIVLLTVTFDPVHDQPEVLAEYGKTWKANPDFWHLLTGPVADVQRVCTWFGLEFWPDEALLVHTLHTAVIDRGGKLVANLEGNQYTAEQLGDLAETVMNRPKN
jgi:protein SCO1